MAPNDAQVFFGVDPGTAVTGYGAVAVTGATTVWIDSGVICTPRKAPLAERLRIIHEGLSERIQAHRPICVCVEQAFYAKNVRTTMVLGHARGVALLAAAQSGARVEEFSPREVKKAVVGAGNAAKEQVAYMVKFLLSPPAHAKTDAYDALAVALCGIASVGAKTALALGRKSMRGTVR